MKKHENFSKALKNLREGLQLQPPYSVVEQTGILGLFNLCFERAWKLAKEVLESHGMYANRVGSLKVVMKTAYEAGMIHDEEIWLDMIQSRNRLAHMYDENTADLMIVKVTFSALKCRAWHSSTGR